MKDTIYRPNFRSITDFTGITVWLERMASKGWMLDRIGPHLWRFRRIEPQQIHFSVTYLTIDSTLLDPEITPETHALEEFCAGTGWYWVASRFQMQIFANEEPDPLPMETDPVAQVQNLHRTMEQKILPGMIGISVLSALLALFYFWLISGASPSADISSMLFGGICCILLVVLELAEMLGYYLWYRRASAAAETGTVIPSRSQITFQIVVAGVMLALTVWWLSASDLETSLRFLMHMGMVWMFQSIFGWMRRKTDPPFVLQLFVWTMVIVFAFGSQFVIRAVVQGMESQEQQGQYVEIDGVTHVLYQDYGPLKLEDITGLEYESHSYARTDQERFTHHITMCYQHQVPKINACPWLSYTIYDIRIPLVYDGLLEDAMSRKPYRLREEACRDGITVYQSYIDGFPSNGYLLCWDDRIVALTIRLSETVSGAELTQDQLDAIIRELAP